jgi:hypothetical protein
MAARYFQQSPCYEPARDAYTAAQTLPDEERENAMQVAVTILLSEEEGCAPLMVEAPELNESDEDLEQELDDDSDGAMEELAGSSGTSLLQQEQNPLVVYVFGWLLVGGSWPLVIASIVIGLLMAMLCRSLVHMIIRIFRWIRCRVSGNSCSEYSPAGWVQVLVGGGCGVAGIFLGPWGTIFGANTLLPDAASRSVLSGITRIH